MKSRRHRMDMPFPDNLIKILVCCHQECQLPSDSWLLPIRVGAALGSEVTDMQTDCSALGSQCDNISVKNRTYCELTGLYWAWKNLKLLFPDVQYVGLNHYRRYFLSARSFIVPDRVAMPPNRISDYKVDRACIARACRSGKIITARMERAADNLFDQYSVIHSGEDLRCLLRVIHELDETYDEAAFQVLFRSNRFAPYNMFVCQWDQFERYCEWLFRVLEVLEGRLSIESYGRYQSRVFGFMAERLFNIWLRKESVQTVGLPIADFSGYPTFGKLGTLANHMREDLGFILQHPFTKMDRMEFEGIINGGDC